MVKDVFIRPTIREDLYVIKDILNNAILNYNYYLSSKLKTSEDMGLWFEEHQNSNYYSIFTATIDTEVVGWVALSPFRAIDGYDITAELSVYVHPDHYREGIASLLMDKIEVFAKDKGFLHSIISVITASNAASIALHEKHQFNFSGILREIAMKNGHYHDVVIMTKII